jgi:hypothetical protein
MLKDVFNRNKGRKRAPPQKKYPEEYYKQFWIPRIMYEDLEAMARLQKTSVRKAVLAALDFGITNYFLPRIRAEMSARTFVKGGVLDYRKPGPFINEMGEYLKRHGVTKLSDIPEEKRRSEEAN